MDSPTAPLTPRKTLTGIAIIGLWEHGRLKRRANSARQHNRLDVLCSCVSCPLSDAGESSRNSALMASTFLHGAVSRLEAYKRGYRLGNEVPCSISARTPRNMTARLVGAPTLVQLRDLTQPILLPAGLQSRVRCHESAQH